MRSAREYYFRLAQQAANARIYAFPPSLSQQDPVAALPLPDGAATAESLRGSAYADELARLANRVVGHRYPLLGTEIETGPHVEWRKDYIHGRVSDPSYFRFVPYLAFEKVGDHKNIWELNRHQHLVLLAQAFLLTGNKAYLTEIEAQLASWFEQNAFLRGINFASALEVAFRALSWLWIDHLVGQHLDAQLRRRLWNSLYQHGHFLKANLSTYFSRNTHLLGEALALFALGLKFPASGWDAQGRNILARELEWQVQADGSYFEQSTYYHLYALDFFLFYYLLDHRPASFERALRKMARFLQAVLGPAGLLDFFGDDDGGRLFHPYGDRSAFGRATLATCARVFPDEDLPAAAKDCAEQAAWWLGPTEKAPLSDIPNRSPPRDSSELFADSGLVSIVRGPLHFLIDTGGFGPGGAGHSHSDTLSFTIRHGAEELLIDPGTFTYVADPEARNAFRGSGYHNTLRVDGKDQARPAHAFRWVAKPDVSRSAFEDAGGQVFLDATCRSAHATHRRRYLLWGSDSLFVLDDLSGPGGNHEVEQFWHLGAGAERWMTLLSGAPDPGEGTSGWRSRALGAREESPVLVYKWRGPFPMTVATVLLFGDARVDANLKTEFVEGAVLVRVPGIGEARFPAVGSPVVIAA